MLFCLLSSLFIYFSSDLNYSSGSFFLVTLKLGAYSFNYFRILSSSPPWLMKTKSEILLLLSLLMGSFLF